MSRIAIVAALEREVKPLIRDWPSCEKEHSGRRFRFFEKDDTAVICGGIGAQAARRATEAIIALYAPAMVYSVGFAGALDPKLEVGALLLPQRVVDAADGSSFESGVGEGILVSFAAVADAEQKSRLASAYNAVVVDMEAAAVARGAQARGVAFRAVKVISDSAESPMPPMERFIGADGSFRTGAFVIYALLRPKWWPAMLQLARNSRRASRELCCFLQQLDHTAPQEFAISGGRLHSR